MRDIKFRAYNKLNNVMVTFNNVKHGIQYQCGDISVSTGWDSYGEPTYDEDDSHFEVMQCTGLKDKNGVDIYEGDIVERSDYNGALEVKYSNFDYDEVAGYFLFSADGDNAYSSFDGCEVIGNIYENPELVNAEV